MAAPVAAEGGIAKYPAVWNAVAVITLPLRAALYGVLMAVFLSIQLPRGLLTALGKRLVSGRATQILATGSTCQGIAAGGYWGQLVLGAPMDRAKLEQLVKAMVEEAGGDAAKARVLEGPGAVAEAFPPGGRVAADHYVEAGSNWLKVALGFSKTAPKGADAVGANLVVLRLWTGKPGQPTVVQFFLPGGGWDGSSNFNFMKELLARYHGEAPTAVFKAGKTVLKAESKATLDKRSFLGYLCRLPYCVVLNVSAAAWSFTGALPCFGGAGLSPEVACIVLSEAQSAALAARAKERGAKPFAALTWACVKAYKRVLGRYPANIVQQASYQTRHYPVAGAEGTRDFVGDWLFGPIQRVPPGEYDLAAAQRGYAALLGDLDAMAGSAADAFDAKAYGPTSQGASGFEASGCYGLPTRLASSSIFFNNYGVRTMTDKAKVFSWSWAMPGDVGCNCICVNGKTTMTIASMHHGIGRVTAIRDVACDALLELIGDASAV